MLSLPQSAVHPSAASNSGLNVFLQMIPPVVKAGFRVIAPDLIGFGRSDKPSKLSDYSYQASCSPIANELNARLHRSDTSTGCGRSFTSSS